MSLELIREGWRDRARQLAVSEANKIIREERESKPKNNLPDENKPEMRENKEKKDEQE